MWWLALLGLLIGLMLGLAFSLSIPAEYGRYAAIGILSALDSLLGAGRAETEGKFDNRIFLSGFVANTLLAGLLTFLGDRLGVELYYAAIVAFGVRIFSNLSIIRRQVLTRLAGPETAQGANSD